MKKIFSVCAFIALMSIHFTNAQEKISINETTIIKNEDGKKINFDEFSEKVKSGSYIIQQKKDSKGNEYIQLIKTSPEQKKRMLEMMENKLGQSSRYIGKKVPDFSFTDIDGNPINSENTKGKVVVMNFWFAACKPCINELPELNEVYEKYRTNKDIVFASVTFERKKKIEQFEKRYPISYPVVGQAKSEFYKFNISSFPTNLIIDKEGKFSYYISGGFDGIGKQIENAIEKTLK